MWQDVKCHQFWNDLLEAVVMTCGAFCHLLAISENTNTQQGCRVAAVPVERWSVLDPRRKLKKRSLPATGTPSSHVANLEKGLLATRPFFFSVIKAAKYLYISSLQFS